MKILAIIPAYNEELNLENVVNDIKKNGNCDYIIINDCSTDKTEDLCKKNNYNYITLPINYGLTSAIQVGMKYAKEHNYDIAIQFDGDGQHQAKYIKNLSKAIEYENVDIVIGSRFVKNKKPISIRMLGSRILTFLIKLTTLKKISDPSSGMRAYNKRAIDMFNEDDTLTPEPDTIVYMIKKGLSVKEVQVDMAERKYGKSYFNVIKSIKYMINICLSILLIRAFTFNTKKEK